jgi:hypothetical protein
MQEQISAGGLASFFAYAPIFIGLIILVVAWAAKRHEETAPAVTTRATFACAGCGRRGSREHMLPQVHEGAVSWYCAKCAGH